MLSLKIKYVRLEPRIEIRTKNGDRMMKVHMTHNKMFPIRICYEKLVCFETLVNDTKWL